MHSCNSCHAGSGTATQATPIHTGKITGLFCDDCHRVTNWSGASYSHAGVNSGCSNCHDSAFAPPSPHPKPSPPGHTTSTSCQSCHNVSSWASAGGSFTHAGISGYYQHSGARTCSSCHGNTSGGPIAHTAYYPNCAWCHSSQFRAGSHVKTQSPNRVLYTVNELQNCNGACHEYTNSSFTTIKTARNGHHRPTDGGF